MSDEVSILVSEIENVDALEFWWESKLLQRCYRLKDPRVVQALLIRHHCLMNKDADSAHVIRNTIKIIEGPKFDTLWGIIDSESNKQHLIQDLDNLYSRPWAAAYVLGEVGGAPALSETTLRLSPSYRSMHFLTAKLAFHLTTRYIRIQSEGEPTVTQINTNTGEMTQVPARQCPDPEVYERIVLRRQQANEYFVPVSSLIIKDLKTRLSEVPDDFIPMPKQELLEWIEHIPFST